MHFVACRNIYKELNAEQKSAVEGVLKAKNFPLPYIIFGPPGTGKTRTIVAAVEQIYHTSKKKVLVCALTNSACDEITDRLLKVIDSSQIYRVYAKSFDEDKVNSNIRLVSNWSNFGFNFPPLRELYKYRVVVCTLFTSGCLTRAYNADGFNPAHFAYVIIDECASAHEPMTLIPIAGQY